MNLSADALQRGAGRHCQVLRGRHQHDLAAVTSLRRRAFHTSAVRRRAHRAAVPASHTPYPLWAVRGRHSTWTRGILLYIIYHLLALIPIALKTRWYYNTTPIGPSKLHSDPVQDY